VLLILAWLYAAQGARRVLADLRDPVQSPFVAVPAITAMMLAAALASVVFTAGRVLVVIFLAVTIGIGGWLSGRWIAGETDLVSVHPGYYLPTVAGGLVGAITLMQVHLRGLAEASFGIGIVSWLLLGSVVLNRLITAKALPAALQPVTAIELAPPALAAVAWFALASRGINLIAYAIGGYLVLMALVQVRLIPEYLKSGSRRDSGPSRSLTPSPSRARWNGSPGPTLPVRPHMPSQLSQRSPSSSGQSPPAP
jgi:tellurite resistance protein